MDPESNTRPGTGVWHTLERLDMPIGSVRILQVDRDLEEPDAAQYVRRISWGSRLMQVKDKLEQANPQNRYMIIPDPETGKDALFLARPDGSRQKKMWDGVTVTLAQSGYARTDEGISINTYPIDYSEWIACSNPQYAKAFSAAGLALPYAGLGACVLLNSLDGFSVLMRRGIETPVYPGMTYPAGGGPKPGQGSAAALLEEIVEEAGLRPGEHFDPAAITAMAFVADTHFDSSAHMRPELIARVEVPLTYGQIAGIYFDSLRRKGRKETDVWGIEPCYIANPELLKQYIKFHGNEMCPPGEAALTYELLHQLSVRLGPEAAFTEVCTFLSQLKGYRRNSYSLPISMQDE